ncbi:protein Shroom2 isoform X2 [Heptranchias perlo]|uniref:protein Shroom2 isoform X2 n=1 Tax=Heptranchias perlo TaxID=212740 RepID=UPI003559E6FF
MAGEGVRTKGAAAAEEPGGTEQAMGEQHPAKERRAAEGSRCVEVALSGGAPWGFTLRGGREHREPLLITKIEDGSKAAAMGKLQVGDEMVSINDVILTGFRQEAICLVKGSHKTLKIVVRRKGKMVDIVAQKIPSETEADVARSFLTKILRNSMRRNEPVSRPHSWHSTKFIDSQSEAAMMQLSSGGVCSSWHSRYHATSSSNDLSNTWDQTNLHRISDQFSSLGSMDSLDQPPPIYQHGRLSPAKSSNSMDHIAHHNKRDSAYSSFSTSSSTPDYTLSSSKSDNSSSTENMLNRMAHWEAGRPGNSRHGQSAPDPGGLEEKQGHLAPATANEEGASPRPDDQPGSRHYSSGRASFGPVWHVPEKRIVADSRVPRRASPPPPPPVRSDSFAATKVHEKAHACALADGSGTPRHPALNKPQLRGDWASEATERGEQRLVCASGRTSQPSSPYANDASPPALLDNSKQPNASKLQYSLSSTDVRFVQPSCSSCHQRQYSDESTFYHGDQGGLAFKAPSSTIYQGPQERPAESSQRRDQTQARPTKTNPGATPRLENSPSPDSTGPNRYFCITSRQPSHVATRPSRVKVECWDGHKGASYPSGPALGPVPRPLRYHPSPQLPPPELNGNSGPCRVEGGRSRTWASGDMAPKLSEDDQGAQRGSYGPGHGTYPCGQQAGYSDGGRCQPREPCWLGTEGGVICPDKTPMLHSLAQESRNLQANRADLSCRPPSSDVNPLVKQQRRSDRFATALRNEIQSKRAQLQKSKSAATLMGAAEVEEAAGSCQEESTANSSSSSDGSSSTSYKDDLKEAQARVLRATSFKRRDLGPAVIPPDRCAPAYTAPALAPATAKGPPSLLPGDPRLPARATTTGGHHLSRVGGRKRLTPEQKLRSYSEPDKINEVGLPDDAGPPQPGRAPPGSFADRRQFFEESSKTSHPAAAYSRPTPKPSPRPTLGETHWRQHGKTPWAEAEERHPGAEGRARASSLGLESGTAGPHGVTDPGESWLQGKMAAHPSGLPDRPTRAPDPSDGGASEHEAEPQRLGTFAEYQATWREQRKLSEARSSGRYHSADNILDQSCQEPVNPQYVHERSRSSPSTDFYLQDVLIEVRRQPEGFQKEMERTAPEAGRGRKSPSVRHLDSGSKENTSDGQTLPLEQNSEHNWSARNVQGSEHLSQESHEQPVTMLSGHHYPDTGEDQVETKPEPEGPQACPEDRAPSTNWATGEDLVWAEEKLAAANRRKGASLPKTDKYKRQEPSHSGLTAASEPTQAAPDQAWVGTAEAPTNGTDLPSGSAAGAGNGLQEPQLSGYTGDGDAVLEKAQLKEDDNKSSAFHFLPKTTMDVPRSPSPQFAPQRLTDRPPLTLEDDDLARIEKVTENNTTVKKVPIKIVRSESQTEKESRHNLLNNVDLIGFPDKEQPKTIGSCEHPYSLFAAYSRQEQEQDRVTESIAQTEVAASDSRGSEELSPVPSYVKTREKSVEDIKSEELAREIVDKDRSLADILYPNSKMKTTMDLMEGIFPKDDTFLEEAQQRRKLLPRSYSPKTTEEREEETMPIGVSLTTSSTYYSTSAPKAELLNKMKDMQQQMEEEEDSEDELNHDLTEKKQELIDSISKKLQVLREARESLQDDIQANNLLGDEVEAIVKEVCKPNEFDKFKMFIGDLDKVVNLLLSLSGRLARVENALNTLEDSTSPDERRTLTQKQKLLTRQHEDAKELKENLDRRERVVFDILSSYLTDEHLQDYEHFVKMKSALIIEQRELEDKIKLGEEQLKCLLESLPLDSKPK